MQLDNGNQIEWRKYMENCKEGFNIVLFVCDVARHMDHALLFRVYKRVLSELTGIFRIVITKYALILNISPSLLFEFVYLK
jgi:hypothetical protein